MPATLVRKAPKTIVQAQFSIPYTVATALIDGGVGMDHFADASLVREDLLALASKVDASVDAEIERQAGRNISPVMVEVEMDDGTIHRERVDVPLGHPDAPMSEDDFNGKAHDCMRASIRPLGDDAVARLRAQVNQLEKHKDARELIKALSPVT